MIYSKSGSVRSELSGPLVSVVIPVYNVMPFLSQCLDSILCQTYSNLEVLLVDDGSTDESGRICDDYEKRFPVIRVIHQHNTGLSGARNTGLSAVSGEYVIFIDSDDFIASDCIQTAVHSVISTRADMVLFRFNIVGEQGKIMNANHIENEFPNGVISGKESCKLLFERRFENYIWRQLTLTATYKENFIEFPLGKVFEDRYTTYKLLFYSASVAFVEDRLYYYRQRKGSIIHGCRSRYLLDDLEALQGRTKFVEKHLPLLMRANDSNVYSSFIGIYRNSMKFRDEKNIFREIRSYIYANTRIGKIFFLPYLPFEKRIQLLFIKTRVMIILFPVINLIRKMTGHSL